jgi:hypothetical protein
MTLYEGDDLERRGHLLTVELSNLWPVDLVDLTTSLSALDRGIIESVWPKAVKPQFLSETAKEQVLSLAENPFQRVFLVDAEVHEANGRPALYLIIEVKDIIET